MNISTPTRIQSIGLLPFALLALSTLARAEDPPAQDTEGGREAIHSLRTVVVEATAVRDYRVADATVGVLGNLSLINTPFSVNVLSRDLLDNQQALGLGDYLKNDPTAVVGNVPVGFANLRGYSVGPNGFLYDGVPGNGGLSNGKGQLIGFDRIEVLKGASAFMSGLGASTSLGGTLNYVPKRPGDVPVREVAIDYVSRSVFGATADIADRFGPDRAFGFRLNVGYQDGEQAVERANWTQKAAVLALDWRVGSNVLLQAGLDYLDNHNPRLQPFFAVSPGVAVPRAPDASKTIAERWDNFEEHDYNGYLRADWALSTDWSLTAQYLNSHSVRPDAKEARFGFISSTSGDVLMFGSQDVADFNQQSGQLNVHGRAQTGAISHQLTVGASVSKYESSGASNFLGAFPSNLYTPVQADEPAANTPVSVLNSKVDSSGFLASDLFSFNDQWSVLAGARYSKLDITSYNPDGTQSADNSISKTLPVGAVLFKPTAASLLYINYAAGLEPGGTAPTGAVNVNQVLPPLITKQFEIGAKLETAALTLTAALFDMKKPLEYLDPVSLLYVQNGEQRHRGLELLATGLVSPDLRVVAGTMLLDAKANSTGDAATDGRHPVGVPRVTANLFADYQIKALPGLFLNAGAYYNGSSYLDAANTQPIPSWTRFDLGARYESQLGKHRARYYLTVENVADKSYWASAVSGILTLAEPLTVKLTARFGF